MEYIGESLFAKQVNWAPYVYIPTLIICGILLNEVFNNLVITMT